MKSCYILFLAFAAFGAQAAQPALAGKPCSEAWNRAVEATVATGDRNGHGPDIGSDEWKSVVEFKLGVRGNSLVPPRTEAAWCGYIDSLTRARTASGANAPAFACSKVRPGSAEAVVCNDPELSALDRKLAGVYAAAKRKAVNEHPPTLKAEQRGWISGRDECWKSPDMRVCVRDEYVSRIAALQARYRLVKLNGPVRLACEGDPRNEVFVTYFETEPPTLIAERGDQVSLMYLQSGEDSQRYVGRNESVVQRGGEALVTWGYQAPTMHCVGHPR